MLCPIVDHLEIKINQDNYSNGKFKILFSFSNDREGEPVPALIVLCMGQTLLSCCLL